jgi:hypothetical protein
MQIDNTDALHTELYNTLNPSLLKEVAIIGKDQPLLDSQDTEEDDIADTYQRLPQFKLSERRSRFF